MSPSPPPLLRQPRTWIIAVAAVVVLLVGARFVIHLIQGDPPDRLTLDDVPTVTTTTVDGTTTTAPTSSSTGGGSPSTAVSPTTVAAAATDGIAGSWKVAGGSKAGYRVPESLFGEDAEAVGRTSDVSGTMAIDGTTVTAAAITVDMTTVASDRSQRDGQFRGRIMSTSQFPTATFTLTKPIALGSVPADGTQIGVQATGKLTLRGVTNTVTFTLTAKRSGSSIAVNGTIPVAFDDYDIPDASGGPATVGRNGEVELLLVFSR